MIVDMQCAMWQEEQAEWLSIGVKISGALSFPRCFVCGASIAIFRKNLGNRENMHLTKM